jgi:tRNA(His) 5'-end guanylyltransferase
MSEVSHQIHVSHVERIAGRVLPAFRDKFDFSNPEDFDKMAAMAIKAAEAFVGRIDAMMTEAEANDEVSSQLQKERDAEIQRRVEEKLAAFKAAEATPVTAETKPADAS